MERKERRSNHRRTWILGAGMTGLAASIGSSITALEAKEMAGGICRSFLTPVAGGYYRFEVGGGHWVFGTDPILKLWLDGFAEWRHCRRRSAVYLPDRRLRIPYPIQNHLHILGPDLAERCLAEMKRPRKKAPAVLSDWLEWQFGRALTELFFAPFHELYTAGLWTKIAPQDSFKTPLNFDDVERGVRDRLPTSAGYNREFIYPAAGMGPFADRLAEAGRIQYNVGVGRIDVRRKRLELENGEMLGYERLLSTLPLDKMLHLAGLDSEGEPLPANAVLVANIGGLKGPHCPDEHWLYIPRSRSGMYRVGCYSNVDPSWVPASSEDRVGFYVERGLPRDSRPSPEEEAEFARNASAELQEWGFLGNLEVSTTHWIETAYTWSLPGSSWRELSLKRLAQLDIFMAGRFGNWKFQGIADSLREGLMAGMILGNREKG